MMLVGISRTNKVLIDKKPFKVWDDTYATYFNGSIKIDGSGVSNVKIANSANNYWNKRGDYLALWNSSQAGTGNDAGSNFMFEEVQPTNDILYAEYKRK